MDLKNTNCEKVQFWQLVVKLKIANFANVRRNNSTFAQKKKTHFKIISSEKSRILAIFRKLVAFFWYLKYVVSKSVTMYIYIYSFPQPGKRAGCLIINWGTINA